MKKTVKTLISSFLILSMMISQTNFSTQAMENGVPKIHKVPIMTSNLDSSTTPNKIESSTESAGSAEYVTTGGKHLGDFTSIGNIVILIDFSDSTTLSDTELESIDQAFNGKWMSMKKYLQDYTYGKTTVTTYFARDLSESSQKKIWSYKSKTSSNYYRPYKKSTNPDGYKNDDEGYQRLHALFKLALENFNSHLPEGINPTDLDYNNDGYVDNLTFLLNTQCDSWGNVLWPHKWVLNAYDSINAVPILGKLTYYYNLNFSQDAPNGSGGWPAIQKDIKTPIHEFFHTLGFPDLYPYYIKGDPVGTLDIMSSSYFVKDSKYYPTITTQYSKYTYAELGLAPLDIVRTGPYKVYSMAEDDGTQPVFAKIHIPGHDAEKIYLEYREETDDTTQLTSSHPNWDIVNTGKRSGLVVYRINNDIDPFCGNKGVVIKTVEEGEIVGNLDTGFHMYVYRLGETEFNSGGVTTEGIIAYPLISSTIKSIGNTYANSKAALYLTDGTNPGIIIKYSSSGTDSQTGKKYIEFAVSIPNSTELPDAPIIIKEPDDRKIKSGDNATFNITIQEISGETPSFQWQYRWPAEESDKWTNYISDCTKSTLTKSFNALLANSFLVRCIVTNKNSIGCISVPSRQAVITFENTYNLNFDSMGGSKIAPKAGLKSGNKIAAPTSNPTRPGYNFKGWYKESTYTNPWDFDKDTITEDTTLYAKWEAINGNFSGGLGTESDPYIISNLDNLKTLASYISTGAIAPDEQQSYATAYYSVMSDIELDNTSEFTIGTSEKPFRGVFNGNNHKIIWKGSDACNSLFGTINGAEIRDLQTQTSTDTGYFNTAGLIMIDLGVSKIVNCSNLGTVKADNIAGGIIGAIQGNGTFIVNCTNVGKIIGNDSQTLAGAIIGAIYKENIPYTTFSNCCYLTIDELKAIGNISTNPENIKSTNCVYFVKNINDTNAPQKILLSYCELIKGEIVTTIV